MDGIICAAAIAALICAAWWCGMKAIETGPEFSPPVETAAPKVEAEP